MPTKDHKAWLRHEMQLAEHEEAKSASRPRSERTKEGRYDGREKVTFRLPGPIASTLARAARKRKESRIAPWEKQDIVEAGLRSWFKKHAVAIKS